MRWAIARFGNWWVDYCSFWKHALGPPFDPKKIIPHTKTFNRNWWLSGGLTGWCVRCQLRSGQLHFAALPDNYLLPLFNEKELEEAVTLDPLSADLASGRDLLACLHPRERASLEKKAASSWISAAPKPALIFTKQICLNEYWIFRREELWLTKQLRRNKRLKTNVRKFADVFNCELSNL